MKQMMRFKVLLFILLCAKCTLKFAPAQYQYSDKLINIFLQVDEEKIDVNIYLFDFMEIAVLYKINGNQNTVALRLLNGKISLIDCFVNQEDDLIIQNTQKKLQIIEEHTDGQTYIHVQFLKKINNNITKNILVHQQFQLSYILKPIIKEQFNPTINYSKRRMLTYDWTDKQNYYSKLRKNIILSLCWCFIADIGILIKFLNISYNYFIHIILLTICSIATIIQLVFFLSSESKNNNLLNQRIAYSPLCIIMIILIIIQIVFGILKKIFQKIKGLYPGYVILLTNPHRFIGYSLMILGKTIVIYGWYLQTEYIAIIILGIDIIIAITFFVLYLKFQVKTLKFNIKMRISEIKPDLNQKYNKITKYPYNSEEISNQNFFIFNDQVFEFDNFDFHPGGAKILQLTNRREIDRFIYGMYHLQSYPQLNRFQHPANTFSLLKNPIYQLPKNPLIILTDENFQVTKKQNITQNLSIFHLRQIDGQVEYNQQNNLRSLGQYFTVRGFGLTRIYVSVKSQRRKAREISKKLLESIIGDFSDYLMPNGDTSIIKNEVIDSSYREMNSKSYQIIFKDSQELITSDNDAELCIVVKKFQNPAGFSYQLHQKYKTCRLKVSGLNGRGLCLQSVKKGTIILISGGAVFPFLDLFDMIFKIMASKIIQFSTEAMKQVQNYKKMLNGYKFIFVGAFDNYKYMITPQQLLFMHRQKDPMFKMYVKLTKKHPAFRQCKIGGRFNANFYRKYIVDIDDLSMIYTVGPAGLGQDLIEGAKQTGIPLSKLFII